MLIGLLLSSSTAVAGPGDHIRVGAFELAPTVAMGSEFRSNVYRSEDDAVPAANLDLATGLGLSADGDDHQFDLGGLWELRKFFFVGPQQVGAERPRGQRISALDRFDSGNARFGLDSFRRSRVGVTLHDDVALQNTTADAEYADLPYTTHFRNALGGGLRLSPSPAFSITPGGNWSYDDFRIPRVANERDRTLNERHTYGPDLDVEWRFLPRTALVLDGSFELNDWATNLLDAEDEEEEDIEIPDSRFVKVRGGIDGQFTRRLFAKAIVGYGVAAYQGTSARARRGVSGIDGLLVRFSLRYDLTQPTDDRPGSRISGGYTKDFNDSFFTNYLALDAFDLGYTGRFGRFEPRLAYSLRFERYEGELQRSDLVNRLDLEIATPLRDWARLSIGGWWQQRASDMANVEYDDFHFRLSTRFSY